ncbi:retrovirus-related pol polyprotein from transposon TNT 1-94 [Tanacetum coccineum]
MSNSNQQTLANSRAIERPPMLEKGNYIPWESRFRRFLDNNLEDRERMWNSIQNGPYKRPMIPNPDNDHQTILKPLSKMTEGNKKQYIADVKVMSYLLQAILNDIYNSVDAFVDYEDEYQGELQGDSQEDKRTTAMMLLARAITQKFFTPINNRLRTSSNTRNQAVVQDGRVDIQTKNTGYGGNGKENVQCYNYIEKGHYARDCQKLRVRDAKYFREQMLLAMKDEAGSILKDEENDFLLDNSYGEETMEELTAVVMLMARIQPADGNAETVPSYDAKAVSEVNASSKLAKKAFKERENRYLEDIVDLDEKLSSHDRIIYKIAGLGYKNLERLKKAIAAQPKMYDGERLHSAKLTIISPDSEETLEDAEESRLKMRNKMVQINYGKLNALYETFVPQQEFSVEQTYFSIPSTSNNGSESKEVTSDLPIPKMPKESKLLKMFDTMGVAINSLRTRIDKTLLEDRERRWMSDSQNSLREFYKTDVILMSASLSKNLKELKEELIEEVQEMLNIFESMEQKVNGKSSKENILQNEIDRLLEVSLTSVESSNHVRRPKSNDTKSKDIVLKNNNDKRPSAHVRKMSSSVSIDSNKRETMHSNTQEGMVNEGIELDAGLDSKASTYDTTSTKQQDESSSLGHAADAELKVHRVVSLTSKIDRDSRYDICMKLLLKNINIFFKQSKFTTSRDGYEIEGELKEYEDSRIKTSVQVFYKAMLNQYHRVQDLSSATSCD